jgi:hypothetical protein
VKVGGVENRQEVRLARELLGAKVDLLTGMLATFRILLPVLEI